MQQPAGSGTKINQRYTNEPTYTHNIYNIHILYIKMIFDGTPIEFDSQFYYKFNCSISINTRTLHLQHKLNTGHD